MNKYKLRHNFWELNNLEKIIYFISIRPFWSRDEKKFFEGNFLLPGQMYRAERKGLYDIIRESKPDYCFEIGTYTGGGSTFFISKALKDNKKGILITTESNKILCDKAKDRYKKYIPSQYPLIEFINSSSVESFEKYLKDKGKKVMIFLDGAEDGDQTFQQYNFFRPYFTNGTILALHDWNTEKTIKVRPAILSDKHWIKISELVEPDSIGFVIFRYN